MIGRLRAFGLCMVIALAARADNEAAWNEAMVAVKGGRDAEALAAFVKMAGAATNLVFKTDALEQGALCASRLKQLDAALSLAARIPDPMRAKGLRLRLLGDNWQWQALVAAFKDESFARWPAQVRGEAYRRRGEAYYHLKDGVRAEADLTQAVAALLDGRDRLETAMTLGDTYHLLLKNDEKALATYLGAQSRAAEGTERWGWAYYTVTTTAAGMLSARGRHAEALATLGKVDINSLSGHWRAAMLSAYGAAYAAQGRLVEAIAKQGEASRVQGITAGQKAEIEKTIAGIMTLLASTNTAGADLVLAVGGRSDYQVVLPDSHPDATIAQALTNAAFLIRDAFAANGFDIPVTTESARNRAKRGLYLGNTAFARAQGVKVAALGGWSYRHKAVGRDVIIAGCDRPCPTPPPGGKWPSRTEGRPELGTVKAVADFLRLYVGTRFLYPGATGTEFLATPVIAVPKTLDTLKTSAVSFSYHYWQTEDPFYIANNYFFPFNLGHHNWEGSIPAARYRETHPEYFALVNGQRCCLTKDWTGTWAEQYCLSNPNVQELLYKALIDTVDRGFDVVSVNHPDGFAPCQCPDCYALYGTGADWGEKVWIFYRKMAERLQKERPRGRVRFYAYGPTEHPPKTFTAFPDNTGLLLCSTTPESFAEWSRCRVPQGFGTYLYNWGLYHRNTYAPKRTVAFIEDQVRRFYENHVQGCSIDGFGETYGLDGPTYYAFGRMWDDPAHNRGDNLLDEFCTAAFAEGAIPMKRFFEELHHALASGDMASRYQTPNGQWRSALDDPNHYYSYVYTPGRLAAMETQLQRAELLATADKARARLTLVRREFDYLKSNLTVIRFYEAYLMRPDAASRECLLNALDTRRALIDSYHVMNKAGQPVGQKPIPGWPEMHLFAGRGRDALVLAYEPHRFDPSVFGWDTAAIRATPLVSAKRLAVKPATGPVTLAAPVWATAEAASLGPVPGEAGGLAPRTSVQALYDTASLYLRLECDLPGAPVSYAPVRRDGEVGKQEALDISLAPGADKSKAYHFMVGPATGAIYDAASGFIADPVHPLYGKDDPSWNGDWVYEPRLEAGKNRWLALLHIPFRSLGVEPPKAGTVWSGNFGRLHHAGTNPVARSIWSAAPGLKDLSDRNSFGDLVFEK